MLSISIFSILFTTVSIIALTSGILVLVNNCRESVNISYFSLMVAIAIWSVGLAFAVAAPNEITSENWRRFSAFGWGSVYAIALHFVIHLTGTRLHRRKNLIKAMIYFPAFLTILAFALPLGINPVPYHLQQSRFGWVNVRTNDVWDMMFYAYYLSYTFVGIFLLMKWGRGATDRKTKNKARFIVIAILSSLIIGSFTDVVLSGSQAMLPQITPFIMLIPILAIYSTMRVQGMPGYVPGLNKSSYLSISISVTLYMIITYIQVQLSYGDNFHKILMINESMTRGIITQLQMIISIYLVLRQRKPGLMASILLNAWSLIGAVGFMLRQGSPASLPGIISYTGVLLLIFLIRSYMDKTVLYIERIDSQKEKLEKSEETLYHMAYFDSLTELPNKDSFFGQVSQDLLDASRENTRVAIMFVDFDSFKSINDIAGHSTGDRVLQQIAQRLSSCLGHRDMVARFAGDEFLIKVADYPDDSVIHAICNSIMEVLTKPFTVQEIEYFVSASIGVAVYPYDGEDVDTLVKNADIAMYTAKRMGKNQVVFCTSDMKDEITKKLKLTNELHRAVEKDELFLVYQPLVRTKTKDICGYEALLRWNNDDNGIISPKIFIPLAEKTGMIKPIGLWVLRRACDQLKLFKGYHSQDISISVNISPLQLKDPTIAKKINDILFDTKTEAKDLTIEITEGVAFQNEPFILDRLKEIRSLGVSIAIDDFGIGYSSLSRLMNYPIDLLKIDIEFVRGISSEFKKNKAMIKSIIQLAKNLGIKVLAEGVETEQQYSFLKEQECDFIQGYYFYHPMLPDEIMRL